MKKLIFILFFISLIRSASAQLYFPPVSGNAWDTISPASLGWCQDKIDTLLDYLETQNTKAFIILKDGKIVVEKYFGTFTEDSVWYWASAGKSLTGFITGIAKQEGFVNLNDSTSHYLGSGWTICPPTKEGMITILDQLRMTTGLNDLVPDNYCTDDTCLEYLADAGTRWAYHTAPYTLLDGVIENGTGQTLNQYLLNKIKLQTGMTGSFFPVGYLNLFISKARSMARFGLLILNRGNWDGIQIMTDTAYFNAMVNTSQNLNPSYGYLWWLNGKPSFLVPGLQVSFPGPLSPHAPSDMIAALGKNGQLINVVPSENLVFIRMGDAPNGSEVPFTMNDTIWEKLYDVMCSSSGIASMASSEKYLITFPNPSSGEISFNAFHTGIYTLKTIDGKNIAEGFTVSGENKIDLSIFENGVYILCCGDQHAKIIVQH
jgi:CubicO group peptidase (beta-lactamase class C family)